MLEKMIQAANKAREKAYAPYSGFYVGVCLRSKNNNLYVGANVENAAYPQSQCAESSAIGALIAGGEKQIAEIVVIGSGDGLCTPCGGCRQRLNEFSESNTLVHVCGPEGLRKTFKLGQLLPAAFGPNNLDLP